MINNNLTFDTNEKTAVNQENNLIENVFIHMKRRELGEVQRWV
jgi:hypothetical protein